MTPEEKEAQILEQQTAVEGEPHGNPEEFRILAGEGIEYKTGEITFVIPNIKIKDYYRMMDFEKQQEAARNGTDVLNAQIDFIAQFTKADRQQLIDHLDKQDCERILALLFYSWLEGKAIFKKKTLTYSDLWAKILHVRDVVNVVNRGS